MRSVNEVLKSMGRPLLAPAEQVSEKHVESGLAQKRFATKRQYAARGVHANTGTVELVQLGTSETDAPEPPRVLYNRLTGGMVVESYIDTPLASIYSVNVFGGKRVLVRGLHIESATARNPDGHRLSVFKVEQTALLKSRPGKRGRVIHRTGRDHSY